VSLVRCKSCCMPTTRPDLHFEDGECAACRNFKNRPAVDWDARKEDLIRLLDKHHGECIVPSSGGKDSTYQVIKLLELGAHVTVVTATTCHLTQMGRRNIDNLARYATTYEVDPNKDVRRKLNRIGLKLVGDISLPEHMSIFSTPMRMSKALGIPLVFYGESPQMEYGGPPGSEESQTLTRRWVTEFGGLLGMRPGDFVGMDGITERDMKDYSMPTDYFPECHFLGQYIPWDSRENARVAVDHGLMYQCPSAANYWEWENLDNAQTGLHDYFGFLKFGFGRTCSQVSVDVRHGRMTREMAMRYVVDRDGQVPYLYAGVFLSEVLSNIYMTEKELWRIADQFTNWDIFRRVIDDEKARPMLVDWANAELCGERSESEPAPG
jgi:N-acetyl sugar amidotransferase